MPQIVCAGRTDAGVHAAGQVVHVDLPAAYDADLVRAVNRQLAPAVVVVVAAPVEAAFDARRAARLRRYRYLVDSAPVADPLLARLAWWVAEPLDLRAMAQAADPLVGEHDFRAFCRRAPATSANEPIVRRVHSAEWSEVSAAHRALLGAPSAAQGDEPAPAWPRRLLRFDIAANAFCHQMVRSIVAVLVEAGRGRASAATVMALLGSASRQGAPQPAPPSGLCLLAVEY